MAVTPQEVFPWGPRLPLCRSEKAVGSLSLEGFERSRCPESRDTDDLPSLASRGIRRGLCALTSRPEDYRADGFALQAEPS